MSTKEYIKKLNSPGPWIKIIIIFSVFLGISGYLNFWTSNIPDPDSFYHIRHSWLYRTAGLFNSDFPWTQYSVIRTHGADLWYGFHIFLIPFTYFNDLTSGIKLAALSITFGVMAACYFALKNLGIKFPFLWSVLYIFLSPDITWRTIMTRPHPLSLGLVALIFSFFMVGPVTPLFIFSFLLSWFHSSIFWMAIVVIAPIITFKWLNDQKINLNKIYAILGGVVAGLLARPHPIGNLKLIYTQVIDLYLTKNRELADTIGIELRPPSWTGSEDTMIVAILFIAALAYLGWLIYKKRTFDTDTKVYILSSLVLSFFSILMYVTSQRAIDILGLFVLILGALAATHFFEKEEKISWAEKRQAIALLLVFFTASIFYSWYGLKKSFETYSLLPTKFKEPALWLEKNTNKNDIVFNLYWDQFPFLFYWNRHNYYINGMDPIFMLTYNRELYWKIYYMSVRDMAGLTCGLEVCGPDNIISVYDSLTKDFHASYVFIRKLKDTRFLDYIEKDKKHFQKVYEEGHSIIFKVLPEKTKPLPTGKKL